MSLTGDGQNVNVNGNLVLPGPSTKIRTPLIQFSDNTTLASANGIWSSGPGGLSYSGNVFATNFSGNASNLSNLTGAAAGTYGSGTSVPSVTVDASGRITSISTTTINTVSTGTLGQLAYYTASNTLGGDVGLGYVAGTQTLSVGGSLKVSGDIFVSGNTYVGNNVVFNDAIVAIGNSYPNGTTMGLLMQRPAGNVMMGYLSTEGGSAYTNALVFGYTFSGANGSLLTPDLSNTLNVQVLGSVSSTTGFYGNVIGSNTGSFSNISISSSIIGLGPGAGASSAANTISVGASAGRFNQGSYSIALGDLAGYSYQDAYSVAIGSGAGKLLQGQASVAIGKNAGNDSQGPGTVSIGGAAGQTSQGQESIAIGDTAGQTSQGYASVAIGSLAGNIGQKCQSVAIGFNAGKSYQDESSVAIGAYAGGSSQGRFAVAMGLEAGGIGQEESAVAIGFSAGNITQKEDAVAIGRNAGATSQGSWAVAIGVGAAQESQGNEAIAIGDNAGAGSQGSSAIAIGYNAGNSSQGSGAIAIDASGVPGAPQAPNSVLINASSGAVDPVASGFYVAPIRYLTTSSNVVAYNQTTREVTDTGAMTLGTYGASIRTGALYGSIAGSNTVSASNITVSGNVSIGNATVSTSTLTVGSNLFAYDLGSNVLVVSGNVSASRFTGNGSTLTGLTGATPGLYGNATTVSQITVDATGRITGISNVTIAASSSSNLAQVVNLGNATANTVLFTNTTTSLVASGNVLVQGQSNLVGNTVASNISVYSISFGGTSDGYVRSISLQDTTDISNSTTAYITVGGISTTTYNPTFLTSVSALGTWNGTPTPALGGASLGAFSATIGANITNFTPSGGLVNGTYTIYAVSNGTWTVAASMAGSVSNLASTLSLSTGNRVLITITYDGTVYYVNWVKYS